MQQILRIFGIVVSIVKTTFFVIRSKMNDLSEKLHRFRERIRNIQFFQLIGRTIQELGTDDASHMAAGVAYYVVLSLFPLVIGIVAILGIFLSSNTVQDNVISFFQDNIPVIDEIELARIVQDKIDDVVAWRGVLGLIGAVALFWAASAMFGAISRAVNRAWNIRVDRPFHIRKLHDIGMAMGTGLLFLLSLGATSIFSILRDTNLQYTGIAADIGARVFAVLLTLIVFLVIYKFTPNTKTYWRYVWPGALFATIVFEILKTLFVLYTTNLANYQSVYGTLYYVVIMLVFIYISAFILIIGAELSSEYERVRRGTERGVLVTNSSPRN